MERMKVVPKRRFTEFEKDWEKQALEDVIDSLYNGQTPSRFNDEFWNGDVNWLSSGELNRGEVHATIEKITEKGRKNANLKVVPKATFIMAITGLEATGTRGNCAILGIDTTLNQSCMAVFPRKELLDTTFLFQWYRRFGEEYGIKYTQGTKQQSYNAELVKKLGITLPNLKEQQKLGRFFKEVDEMIATEKSKVAKTKALKAAYLAEMFPGEGELLPKRRFSGFTGKWEEQRFEDILKMHPFNSYLANPSTEGVYEVIQQGDNPIIGHADGNPFENYNDVVLFGDHTVSIYKPKKPFFVSTDGIKILSADGIEGDYLFTLIDRYKPEPEGYKRHLTILKNERCVITTNIEEQQKIGEFFKQLDDKITNAERKLEKLKSTKQAYLQEMFV